jgi:hypothetical protein
MHAGREQRRGGTVGRVWSSRGAQQGIARCTHAGPWLASNLFVTLPRLHGSSIATIITTHMPRNEAAAPGHVCPGIRIHAIAIVQPPGIGILPIADMDAHQTIVTAALVAKSSAETPKKVCWDARSGAIGREISPPAVAPTTPTTWLSAGRTRRGGATRRPSRYAPWGRGRATGTCPRGRPVRAHRRNRCGR